MQLELAAAPPLESFLVHNAAAEHEFIAVLDLKSRNIKRFCLREQVRIISCGEATCGNFSDTSSLKSLKAKEWIGHAFTVCIRTEDQNQMSFYPFVLHEISVLVELILGHLRFSLTDVPPQPNSPPDNVFHLDQRRTCGGVYKEKEHVARNHLELYHLPHKVEA